MADSIDWTVIEADYVTSSDSYCYLADKYGVSLNQLARHGKDADWVGKREKYREEKTKKMQIKIMQEQNEQGMKCIRKLQEIAVKALEKCEELMDTCATQRQACDLMDAVNTAKNIVRDVYRMPTMTEEASMDNARRKLDLEEKKVVKDDSSTSEIRIHIDGAEEYLK